MKAVHFSDFTGTAIEFRDVPEPSEPNAGQVLVRVKAAGVNRADLIQAAGKYPPPEGYSPYIPGAGIRGRGSRMRQFCGCVAYRRSRIRHSCGRGAGRVRIDRHKRDRANTRQTFLPTSGSSTRSIHYGARCCLYTSTSYSRRNASYPCGRIGCRACRASNGKGRRNKGRRNIANSRKN